MFLNRSHVPLVLALLTGAILPLAFAPYQLWWLAVLSPTALLWFWKDASPKQALQLGFCYGLGFFGVGVSWVYVSIHYFGQTDVPLALFITALFIIILALFPALNGYILKQLYPNPKPNFALCLVGFPSSWVLFEWIRSWIFSGFPWLYLGYTQIDTFLSNYAPILSVYGISLAIVFSSGCIVAIINIPKKENFKLRQLLPLLFLCGVWGGGYYLDKLQLTKPWTYSEGPVQTVALIQGNINPLEKFPDNNPIFATDQIYGPLTENQWWLDLIIWPESAIPLPLPDAQDYINFLDKKAKAHNITFITGLQVINNHNYYNAMIALGNNSSPLYYKRHLVPFGEYLPFDKLLRGLINFFDLPMSDFLEGPDDQPLLKSGNLRIEPLICYEIAFPELVRSSLKDANVIVNISEDGWFGRSWGPYQHLQIARMRALETNRYVLRATTSGISAIIDPKGKIVSASPQFKAMALNGSFQGMAGQTPWVQIGLWPLLGFLIVIFMLFAFINKTRKT